MCFATSALLFAHYHAAAGSPPPAHIAIDPFQLAVWDNVGIQSLQAAGLAEHVDVRPDYSCRVLPALEQTGTRVGLVYIDGSHLFEDVFVDFFFAARLLEPNGLLVFDDSTHGDVAKVLSFLRRNFAAQFEAVDLSHCYRPTWSDRLKYQLVVKTGKNQLSCFRKIGDSRRAWNAPLQNF